MGRSNLLSYLGKLGAHGTNLTGNLYCLSPFEILNPLHEVLVLGLKFLIFLFAAKHICGPLKPFVGLLANYREFLYASSPLCCRLLHKGIILRRTLHRARGTHLECPSLYL